MIVLFNHTRHPDEPIRDILNFAARVMKVKGEICVKISRSRDIRPGGTAHRGYPYYGFMKGTSDRKGRNGLLIGSDSGWIQLHLANRIPLAEKHDWLDAAGWFIDTALHEMAHIFQFRSGLYGKLRQQEAKHPSGRRMRHDYRPCEIDVQNRIYDVMKDKARNRRSQELTIDLAIAMEKGAK